MAVPVTKLDHIHRAFEAVIIIIIIMKIGHI